MIADLWYDWVWFAGVALSITTILVAIVYMLSEFLMNDKMKLWAKMELTEIFYSAIIISIGIFGIPLIDAVVQGALESPNAYPGPLGTPTSAFVQVQHGENGPKVWEVHDLCASGAGSLADIEGSIYHNVHSCHMRLGLWYLNEVFDETKNFAFEIYLSYIKTSMIAEFTINIEFLFEQAGFFTFNPWRGFFTIGNTVKSLVFSWAMKIMMLTKFQEILLRFIAVAVFPAFFVIGAILRTFAFTRRLGGLLLAMAIALYFIFPAFYAFGALVMLNIKHHPDVVNAWNDEMEAHVSDNPNPPIANSMYVTGDFAMVGGDGQFSLDEARESLSQYEGASAEQYYEWMEGKDNPAMIHFDLSNDDPHTEQQKEEAYTNAYEKGMAWFDNISREGKFDKFVTFAWEPNGPIESLSRLTFWSLFFSLFSIIGTIAGIRSLSITFGGDIEIAGLTRLI